MAQTGQMAEARAPAIVRADQPHCCGSDLGIAVVLLHRFEAAIRSGVARHNSPGLVPSPSAPSNIRAMAFSETGSGVMIQCSWRRKGRPGAVCPSSNSTMSGNVHPEFTHLSSASSYSGTCHLPMPAAPISRIKGVRFGDYRLTHTAEADKADLHDASSASDRSPITSGGFRHTLAYVLSACRHKTKSLCRVLPRLVFLVSPIRRMERLLRPRSLLRKVFRLATLSTELGRNWKCRLRDTKCRR
jgi:hypothetical protein